MARRDQALFCCGVKMTVPQRVRLLLDVVVVGVHGKGDGRNRLLRIHKIDVTRFIRLWSLFQLAKNDRDTHS